MSLNLIHRMFGKSRRLSRSEIEMYGKTTDSASRQAIEEKVANDPFEADALEGWHALNYNTSSLKSIDRKFAPSSSKIWFWTGGLAAMTVAGIIAYAFWSESVDTKSANQTIGENLVLEENEISFEESDLIIPEQIEQMVIAPQNVQLGPEEIIQDFADIEAIRKKDPPLVVAALPIIELNFEKSKDLEIIRKHEHAKEIYLHEFKLIDYRNYRSRPTIKTRQLILSGLPADMEDESSEDFEPNWKEVDIPYIDFIDKSMRIFGQANYKRALSRFETILGTYDLDVNAHFYSGLCLYNLGEYEQAIPHFQSCIDGPYSNFDEEAQWMIGTSYEQLGMHAKSRIIFEQIVKDQGYYAQQAARKIR